MAVIVGVLALYVFIKWVVPAVDYEGDNLFLAFFKAVLKNPLIIGLLTIGLIMVALVLGSCSK